MFKLITIGDVLVDTHLIVDESSAECAILHDHKKLCFNYAGKVPIKGSFQSLGGNAANVARGAIELALNTAIIASIGNDPNGEFVTQELNAAGVDTTLVTIDDKALTRYSTVINFQGERTILSYHQKRKYVWPKEIPPSNWIYYTGLSDGYEKIQDGLLKYLSKHPTVRLAINPGSFQLKYAPKKLLEALARADILILNLEEAEMLLNTTLEKEKNLTSIMHQLMMFGAKEVVITDGANGVFALEEDEGWHMESLPVKVIAKTGAGDAFSAGYLAARIKGENMYTALMWGIANSSGVIQKHGPHFGLLDENGIKRMLKRYNHVRPKRI